MTITKAKLSALLADCEASNRRLIAESDELRGALARAYADRDYWLAWKEAVPVTEIKYCVHYTFVHDTNEMEQTTIVYEWIEKAGTP